MKLNHPAKRLTAALLSGAMLFTLCAPALAADTGTAPDPAPAAAAPLNEENGSEEVSFTIGGDDRNFSFTTDRDASFEDVGVSYTHADNILTFKGSFDSLTIDAPGVNVKIIGSTSSTDSPLISGDLTITHSASVYISNMENDAVGSKQAITGSANITSDGTVTICGTDRAVGGEKLTVDAGGDVKIANNVACAAIWKDAEITSRSGSVTIGSNNAGGWAQGNKDTECSLTVTAADDVTLTGGSNDNVIVQNPTIACGGKLTIENTVGDGAVSGEMKYTNSSGQETLLRKDGNFYGSIASGKTTTLPDTADVKKFTAAPEEKVPLELKDCYAVNENGSRGSSFYKGETVTVCIQRPDNGTSVRGWTITPNVTLSDDTSSDGTGLDSNEISFSMPAEKTAITAVWNYYTATSQELCIELCTDTSTLICFLTPERIKNFASSSVIIGDSLTANYLTVTYEDGVYVITGTSGGSCEELNLLGYHGTDGVLPSVKFVSNGYTLNSLDIDGLQNFTATDLCQQRPGTSGSMIIRCSGDVNINGNADYAVYCGRDVTITSGGDVTITSRGETGNALYSGGTLRITSGDDVKITSPYRAVSGGPVIIDCAGDLTLTSTTTNVSEDAVFVESFTVSNAQNVVISSANTNELSASLAATTASITCTGDVKITGANNAVRSDSFRINDAQDVTVHGKNRAFEGYTGTIHCSGNVSLTGENGVAVMSNHFTIDNADQVTLTAANAAFKGTIPTDDYGASGSFLDTPVADITCSGEVVFQTADSKPLVSTLSATNATLTYHQTDSCTYTAFAGQSEKSGRVLQSGRETAGQAFTLTNTDSYSYAKITPDLSDIPDSSAGGDRSGDIGGAIAAVAVGGAAVWGGYEIATRVILNNLLPEGAAIPANRGALALLVWNTAGRPAPAAQPAFADVADPDTAAAAQWCVEQGLLDSRDGSFKPDGRVSKFRVIQVWNKAFPKP